MDYQHLTKVRTSFRFDFAPSNLIPYSQDRSLGYVELPLTDLAQAADGTSSYVSTGKKISEDPIRLEKGTYKGKLFYEAEFVPATRVRNVTFSSGPNAIERAVQGNSDADGDDISQHSVASDENQGVPDGITVSAPLGDDEQVVKKGHRKTGSTDTTATTNTTNTVDTQLTRSTSKSTKTSATLNEKRPEDDAPEFSVEELLQYREYR